MEHECLERIFSEVVVIDGVKMQMDTLRSRRALFRDLRRVAPHIEAGPVHLIPVVAYVSVRAYRGK